MKKQRQLLKLGYVMALLLIVASLIYVACDSKNPTSVQSEGDMIAVLNMSTSYTFETIKPELKKLLAYLNGNPQIITPAVLAKAAKRYATINDLGLSEKFPIGFPLDNGNTFEVYIELFDGSVGNGVTIEDADAYFTLDLDRYPEDAGVADPDHPPLAFEANVAATTHNKRKGLYRDETARQKLMLKSATQKVDYLLLFVGGEERLSKANEQQIYQQWLNHNPGLAKAQADPATQYYWLTFIYLDDDQDFGNEEFEMYYGPNGYNDAGSPFDATTLFVFDGQYRGDKSGGIRLYPDINGTGGYILSPPNYIAVEIVNPDSPAGFKLCAIEDDCTPSKHKNDGQGTHWHNLNVEDIDTEIKDWRTYLFTILDDCVNDDDIYPNSGTVSFGNGSYCEWSTPDGNYVQIFMRKGTIAEAESDWNHQGCTPQ